MRKMRRTTEKTLLDRVEQTVGPNYDRIERNVRYHSRGLDGELDGQAWKGRQFDYYEVKASDCTWSLKKAQTQFYRARRAFRSQLRYCYLVTPSGIYGPQ